MPTSYSTGNTKGLPTKRERTILVSIKLFRFLFDVATTERAFVKPARVSGQNVVTNFFHQTHIRRWPVNMLEGALAICMGTLQSFTNETSAAINI